MPGRAYGTLGRPHPLSGSHLPAEETAPPCAVAPQSVARGAPRSGDRAAAGMPGRAYGTLGRPHPAAGSHLPAEETAPPCAVAFRVVAPCSAPQKSHTPPRPTTGFRLKLNWEAVRTSKSGTA